MKTITIDGLLYKTKDDLWEHYCEQIGSEAAKDFGRNFDAYNDALFGGPGYPGAAKIVFKNVLALEELLSKEKAQFLIERAKQEDYLTVVVE